MMLRAKPRNRDLASAEREFDAEKKKRSSTLFLFSLCRYLQHLCQKAFHFGSRALFSSDRDCALKRQDPNKRNRNCQNNPKPSPVNTSLETVIHVRRSRPSNSKNSHVPNLLFIVGNHHLRFFCLFNCMLVLYHRYQDHVSCAFVNLQNKNNTTKNLVGDIKK
jgi:hypothetical protein